MPPRRNQPVTLARLEAAQSLIAYAILEDGDVYTPYFDRLEREIAALRAREDTVSRARRYLEARSADGEGARLIEPARRA